MNNKISRTGTFVITATASIAFATNLFAEEDQPSPFEFSYVDATIEEARHGNRTAIQQLSIFLNMAEPWRNHVLDRIEATLLPTNLADIRDPDTDPEALRLAILLANAQGIEALHFSQPISADQTPIDIDFSTYETQWLLYSGSDHSVAELFFTTNACTPRITPFAGIETLPARATPRGARYSDTLFSTPVGDINAIRIRRGNCDKSHLLLTTFAAAPRIRLATSDNSAPRLELDQTSIVTLKENGATTLHLFAEKDFLYDVYAAPLDEGVDPALMHLNRIQGETPDMTDDDGGWGLGAHLTPILGNDGEHRVALISANKQTGDVAMLVTRRPIEQYDIGNGTTIELNGANDSWVRVDVPEGTWILRTSANTEDLDPGLEVRDATTLTVLGTNDDESDTSFNAAVSLSMLRRTPIYVRVVSIADKPGSLRLLLEARKSSTVKSKPASFLTAVNELR